jgi:hypothetical protein
MSSTESIEAAPSAPGRLSPIQRAGRIYARPATAWGGLAERGQAWIPLLFVVVFEVLAAGVSYQHVFLPDAMHRIEQSAETNPNMTQEVLDKIEVFHQSPLGITINLSVIGLAITVVILAQALVLWFGTGFVLGARFKYGNALTVVSWSALVGVPGSIVRYTISWIRGTSLGLHLGLGALVPEPETPSKLITGLTGFLDAISPFAAWYLVVLTLGTAALSGAPRRNVAWVLVMLYLALGVFFAAVNALFNPGA